MRESSQVGGEALVAQDDHFGGDVLLAVRLPERAKLRAHVAPLVVRVLMAGRHLLHRVDVHVDVRGRVRRVEHLAEGQHEAARGVLRRGKERGRGIFQSAAKAGTILREWVRAIRFAKGQFVLDGAHSVGEQRAGGVFMATAAGSFACKSSIIYQNH